MIVFHTSFSLLQLLAFELGVCLREKLSAAATSVAGIDHFTSSSHVP